MASPPLYLYIYCDPEETWSPAIELPVVKNCFVPSECPDYTDCPSYPQFQIKPSVYFGGYNPPNESSMFVGFQYWTNYSPSPVYYTCDNVGLNIAGFVFIGMQDLSGKAGYYLYSQNFFTGGYHSLLLYPVQCSPFCWYSSILANRSAPDSSIVAYKTIVSDKPTIEEVNCQFGAPPAIGAVCQLTVYDCFANVFRTYILNPVGDTNNQYVFQYTNGEYTFFLYNADGSYYYGTRRLYCLVGGLAKGSSGGGYTAVSGDSPIAENLPYSPSNPIFWKGQNFTTCINLFTIEFI